MGRTAGGEDGGWGGRRVGRTVVEKSSLIYYDAFMC